MYKKLKMMKKLGNLANKFLTGNLYQKIYDCGLGHTQITFMNTGHDMRNVAELSFLIADDLYIAFIVSETTIDQVNISVHNFTKEEVIFYDEIHISKLNIRVVEKVVTNGVDAWFEETK
jgi:hypothetical protein